MNQQPSPPIPPIRLIGIGNEFRSDDAVGLYVARQLKQRTDGVLDIVEATGEGIDLLELWEGAEKVLLVDAVCSKAKPGTIYRFDTRKQSIPDNLFSCSTHHFGVAQAIEMARVLQRLPARLIVYGIEGKTFTAGIQLSPEVKVAAETVILQVMKEIKYM